MYLRPAWNSQGDRGRELPPKARSLSQISQREKDVEQLEVVAGPWQTTRKTKQNKTKQNKTKQKPWHEEGRAYSLGKDNYLV